MTAAIVLAGIALPPTAAYARPGPRVDALRQRADQLNTRLEQLTEQYDGLRVRLRQAQRAAAVADATSARATSTLRTVQRQIGRFAAQRYMNAAEDDGPALFAASDPRALLDRASTLHYFTQQDDAQVQQLTRAIQNAERAGQNARDRATQASCLQARLTRQRAAIRQELEHVRGPLLKDAVDRADRGATIPPIPGGNGKALGAVRAALSQLGVPYVWGGATPGHGFDCSGLTMWAYEQVGINLPHYGGDQWNAGVHVSRDQLEPGDLVFFYSDIHHMGMYIGDGKFVHAPHTGDRVRIADLSTRPFAGAVRVVLAGWTTVRDRPTWGRPIPGGPHVPSAVLGSSERRLRGLPSGARRRPGAGSAVPVAREWHGWQGRAGGRRATSRRRATARRRVKTRRSPAAAGRRRTYGRV